MLTLVLVALSVGLDNFGAATAIGVAGVDGVLRLRVVVIFGTFEAAMPIAGLLLGDSVSHDLGGAAQPVGGALLASVGVYAVVSQLIGAKRPHPERQLSVRSLIVIAAALSIDNLVIGFSLGSTHVSILAAAVTIGVVSVILSLLGLELGRRLGQRVGQRSELVGGAMLIAVGVAVGTGLL